MRFLVRLPILLVAVLLFGCPYEFDVPLADPRPNSIDERLLGTWISTLADEPSIVEITRFNSSEYFLQSHQSKDNQVIVENYRGYLVTVGDQQMLQINAIGNEKFLLAKFNIEPRDTVTLRFVGEKGIPAGLKANAKGTIDYLKVHFKDAGVFEEGKSSIVLTKAGAAGSEVGASLKAR